MPTATLAVDTDVFSSAATAFLRANDAVCDVVASLASAAGTGGGMAGGDAGGTAWAAVYDAAAARALAAGAGAADRLGELGIGLATAGDNHGEAERTSTPGAPSYAGAPSTPSAAGVIPAMPPSAAGGSSSPPSAWFLVAHLLSAAWPDGDPETLRTVGAAWSRAATSLQSAADPLTAAVGELAAQRSPEIDGVVSRCTAGQQAVRTLAAQCGSLGRACTALADHVEQARDQLTGALADAGHLVGDGFGVLAAVVSGDDVVAEIQKLVATLSEILDHLRSLVDTVIHELESLLDAITSLVGRLADLVTTAVSVAFTIAAVAPAAVTGVASSSVPRVDLTAMEAAGGHTIEEHVGKSDRELVERAVREQLRGTSTFVDLATAEALTAQNIARQSARIARWLGRQRAVGKLELRMSAPPGAGRVYDAVTNSFVPAREVITVLVKTGRGTFIVLTSYLGA